MGWVGLRQGVWYERRSRLGPVVERFESLSAAPAWGRCAPLSPQQSNSSRPSGYGNGRGTGLTERSWVPADDCGVKG